MTIVQGSDVSDIVSAMQSSLEDCSITHDALNIYAEGDAGVLAAAQWLAKGISIGIEFQQKLQHAESEKLNKQLGIINDIDLKTTN